MSDKPRVVHFIGEVNSDNISRIGKETFALWEEDPQAEIVLYIASTGGNVTAGLAFYELVKALKVPLTTVGLGSIASMGLLVWLAGVTRKASRNSFFLVHELFRSYEKVSFRTSEMESEARAMRLAQGIFFRAIAEVSGKSLEEIQALALKDTPMTIGEAIEFGLLREEDVLS